MKKSGNYKAFIRKSGKRWWAPKILCSFVEKKKKNSLFPLSDFSNRKICHNCPKRNAVSPYRKRCFSARCTVSIFLHFHVKQLLKTSRVSKKLGWAQLLALLKLNCKIILTNTNLTNPTNAIRLYHFVFMKFVRFVVAKNNSKSQTIRCS